MATALAEAIAAVDPSVEFTAFDVNEQQINRFSANLGQFRHASDNAAVACGSDLVFLSVKPQVLPAVLPDIAGTDRLVVSIAAGITISTIESALPNARVVRVMPNTPGLVGEMAAGYAAGTRATAADTELVGRLLSSAGVAMEVEEQKLDTVTGLSGSGPAFVARLIEAFTEAGEANGLDHDTAYRLVLATFSGTARLLAEKKMSPEELVTMVSSPNGTTVAGRSVLEASDYRQIIRETVDTTIRRSKELGS